MKLNHTTFKKVKVYYLDNGNKNIDNNNKHSKLKSLLISKEYINFMNSSV